MQAWCRQMFPHSSVAMPGSIVVRVVVLGLASASAYEWFFGCLCLLAPCLSIEQFAFNHFQYSPCAFCALVFVPGSCVAYLLKGTRVACWALSVLTSCWVAKGFLGEIRGCPVSPA